MFRKGYWTHDRFMDVFVEVLTVQYHGPDYTKLKVRWWNRGCMNNPWLITSHPQKIKIKKEHYHNWTRFNPPGGG